MEKMAYRIPEAAEVTGLGRTTLYREIKAGRLVAVKVGTSTLITRDALERYLASLTAAADPEPVSR